MRRRAGGSVEEGGVLDSVPNNSAEAASPVAENVTRDSIDDQSSEILDGVFEGPPHEEYDESGLPEDIQLEAGEIAEGLIHDAILDASRYSGESDDDDDDGGQEANNPFAESHMEQADRFEAVAEFEDGDRTDDAADALPSAVEEEQSRSSEVLVIEEDAQEVAQDEFPADSAETAKQTETPADFDQNHEGEQGALQVVDGPNYQVGRTIPDDDEDRLPALPNFRDDERKVASPGNQDWDRLVTPSSDGSRLPSLSTSRRGSSRPLTSFIDAEVAEIVAARTQRLNQDQLPAETTSFERPTKHKKDKGAQLKPIKGKKPEPFIGPDGKFERVWLTEEEMDQLEKEAASLRKELQELDAGRARRKQKVSKRSASTLGFTHRKRGYAAQEHTLPKMKQIGAHTYVHSVERRKEGFASSTGSNGARSEKQLPEEVLSERNGAVMRGSETSYDGDETNSTFQQGGTVVLSFEADDGQFTFHEEAAGSAHKNEGSNGDAEDSAASRPPEDTESVFALTQTDMQSTGASQVEAQSEPRKRGEQLSGQSLKLLQRTKLSLFNRHWMASKDSDLLMPYLAKEVLSACQSREEFDAELAARRERKYKEEQRQSELDTQKAIRAYKRAERQFTMRADLQNQTAELQGRLIAAENNFHAAKDRYHTLHERLKWKDRLTLKEEADLGRLRQEMDMAEHKLDEEGVEFQLRLHRAFIEKAKNEQEQLRGQRARRHASIQEEVLNSEDMEFFESGGEGPEADSLFAANRLRAAAVQHARRHAKDLVVSLYQCTMALRDCAEYTLQNPVASFSVGEGVEYAGQWGEGGANGVGVETARGGIVYAGQWKNDMRHGLGAMEHPKMRLVYEGTWWNGKRHGYGVEVHFLQDDSDRLPVAFVEYEHGQRVGCKRFDGTRSVEPLLLESVRRVCRQAWQAAEDGRSSHRVQVSHEEGDESGDEGKDGTPRKDEVTKTLIRKRKERKRREIRQAEHESKKQDLKVQKKELEDIEGSVEAALKDLQQSSNETLSNMSASLGRVGLKSGRLFSMTESERTAHQPAVRPPSEQSMRTFLQKKGVPEVLAGRIVAVYFNQFNSGEGVIDESDASAKEQKVLFDLVSGNGALWHTFDPEKRLTSMRKRHKEHTHHTARDRMKAAFSLPGVARTAMSIQTGAGTLRRRVSVMSEQERPQFQSVVSEEQKIQDAMRQLMKGNEDAPVVITVPIDKTLEDAIRDFNKDKYAYILVRPGVYRCDAAIEVTKEIHIVGEVGARIVGSWVFKANDTRSTIRTVALQFEADTKQTDYQRLIHITGGELQINDSALLCPLGYCLWASARSVVWAKGCIFAGSDDGNVRAAAGAVAMEFSRCTLTDSRLENLEESCVFADNDAEARMTNCTLQCADIGVMLTDRARATLNKCTMRIFRRGCFGQMRSSDTELSLKDCTTHGELWGLGEKPMRFIKFGNKHLEEFEPPDPA